MSVTAIIGSQWGDEGKGKITDYYCSELQQQMVIRAQGGSNAGHTLVLANGEKFVLRLLSPHGVVLVHVRAQNAVSVDEMSNAAFRVSIFRAGELVYGKSEVSPIRGWYSPTYAHKEPALSLAVEVTASENVRFITEFLLPTIDG